jgi:hypothetical protein
MWDKSANKYPKVKIYNVDIDFNISEYGKVLLEAVLASFESTNRFLNDMNL